MKLKGTVKNGSVAVDLPDGTPVTVVVEDEEPHPGPRIQVDANGELIMTPELEAEISIALAEAKRGEGIPWAEFRERLRRLRGS